MGLLDEQIKTLQRKKAKIELYQRVADNLSLEVEDTKQDEGLMDEVATDIKAYCAHKMKQIEESVENKPLKKKVVRVEKTQELQEKLLEQPEKPRGRKKLNIINLEDEEETADPLRFVVKYKEWHGKDVLVRDGKGNEVKGQVSGVAFPNVQVLVNGSIVATNPKDIKLLTY